MENKLRIGILNIMPEAEKYEKSILKLINQSSVPVKSILIKVQHHAYKSSDKIHLRKFYKTFPRVTYGQKLDGLILTGAPVENMPFEMITYWEELNEILNYARLHIISTLGICWGGIAIGKFLGIEKTIFNKKLCGVFLSEYLEKGHWITENSDSLFYCPQSRYAGLNEKELSFANQKGDISLLVSSAEAGSFIFESSDERFIAHLGHPEYSADRIIFEYERDQLKGLNNIPRHFDVNNPVDTWHQNSQDFFNKWLQMIGRKN